MNEEEKSKKILENFRKGYMEGFADGYKQAMMEVIEKRQQMELSYHITPGMQSRPPKKP